MINPYIDQIMPLKKTAKNSKKDSLTLLHVFAVVFSLIAFSLHVLVLPVFVVFDLCSLLTFESRAYCLFPLFFDRGMTVQKVLNGVLCGIIKVFNKSLKFTLGNTAEVLSKRTSQIEVQAWMQFGITLCLG